MNTQSLLLMFLICLSQWHFYTSRVADGTPHLGKSGPKTIAPPSIGTRESSNTRA